jgi:hypothetical protein
MTTTPKASERRDGPRIDLRLRVRWSAQTSAGPVSGEAEASDVSPKGLRLESEHQVDVASDLNLVVDVGGDADELVAKGKVMWCRERSSPSRRPVYDVGVSFESDWLARDRGPLGQALARIFAMNSYEPARNFERTEVSVLVSGGGSVLSGPLTMINLSVGGMQLRSEGGLGDGVRAGMDVEVSIEVEGVNRRYLGRVAWVATAPDEAVGDRFGVELTGLNSDDKALLERLRAGQSEPARIVLLLKA